MTYSKMPGDRLPRDRLRPAQLAPTPHKLTAETLLCP